MVEERIKELGFDFPETARPLAVYVPAVFANNFVFTAGQIPSVKGELKYKGKLGKELKEEEGKKASEICILNCLAAVKRVVGNLDRVEQIVKVSVFVNSSEGFTNQPEVANGASELLEKIFGEKGKHARSAIGVSELPRNAAVEIEMICKIS
ncbi:MAG TPA: RidA family protein [Ignavibacteriaceae bacterium]|nr:RidA family protein [Ignavibacteriaceae bacterium]